MPCDGAVSSQRMEATAPFALLSVWWAVSSLRPSVRCTKEMMFTTSVPDLPSRLSTSAYMASTSVAWNSELKLFTSVLCPVRMDIN